ncbi:MAG: PadR family transcriptional regulator [Acidipropionibacterium sp.]|jgi:PadR family transcriptional regulator PadR|nr:PadR family transcriptional regulator [Acidipropionibacterium sp.]
MSDTIRQQWLHGFLDFCLLNLLAGGREYGRGLAARLDDAGLGEVPGGTLYPALLRLEKQGLIGSVRVPSSVGPARKYYQLTGRGRAELRGQRADWEVFRDAVGAVVSGVSGVTEGRPTL